MSKNLNEDLKNAVYKGNLKEVERLLLAGANPNYYPGDDKDQGASLLNRVRRADIAQVLLKHGASVHNRNNFRETPLHTAIYWYGNFELVKMFLKYGADPNQKDGRKNTPLSLAVNKGNLKIIEEILKYGGERDIHVIDRHGYSPLESGFQPSDCAISKLLIKYVLLKNYDNNYHEILNLTPHHCKRYIKEAYSFYVDCDEELRHLRGCNHPLYDIVTSRNQSKGFSNVKLSKIIKDSNLYPIYFQNILENMENIIDRADLLKKIEEIQFYTELELDQNEKKKVYLNYDSIIYIVKYLSNVDLVNFVLALNELTKVMPSSDEENLAKRPKLK